VGDVFDGVADKFQDFDVDVPRGDCRRDHHADDLGSLVPFLGSGVGKERSRRDRLGAEFVLHRFVVIAADLRLVIAHDGVLD
jgi:hypothetical protein